MVAIAAEFDCGVNCLEEGFGVDAGDDEVGFVDGFGTLGAGADADCRERVAYAGEERRLLRKGAAVADHCKGIHLKAVVVVEAEGFVLNHPWIKLES